MPEGGVLPDHEIRDYVQEHNLIKPYNEEQLESSSYDVRLAPIVRVPAVGTGRNIDLRMPVADQARTFKFDLTSKGYILQPGRFVIGSTVEWVNIPDYLVCRIEGKSSLARVGLQIHSAGYVDPGYRGTVTLEIVNFWPRPLILWPDLLIAQLSFEYLSSACRKPYQGRYQDSDGPVASRYGSEEVNINIQGAPFNASGLSGRLNDPKPRAC